MFAGRLMPRGKLPRREGELVILRVAHLRESRYEFEHHSRLGRRVGLREDQIEAITRPLEKGPWSGRERTILTAVDRMCSERDLDDPTWDSLSSHLSERECIELLLLIGHYEMLATFLETLRVPLDSPRRR